MQQRCKCYGCVLLLFHGLLQRLRNNYDHKGNDNDTFRARGASGRQPHHHHDNTGTNFPAHDPNAKQRCKQCLLPCPPPRDHWHCHCHCQCCWFCCDGVMHLRFEVPERSDKSRLYWHRHCGICGYQPKPQPQPQPQPQPKHTHRLRKKKKKKKKKKKGTEGRKEEL